MEKSFLDLFCGMENETLSNMEKARVNAMVKGLTDLILTHNDKLFEDYFAEAMTIQQMLAIRYNRLVARAGHKPKPNVVAPLAESYRDYLRRKYVGVCSSRVPVINT
jgi:hypothetical protein